MFTTSLILDTDSYKASHWKQYPPGLTHNYSYFESRGGDYDNVVFFGLQYYLKEYLTRPITKDDVEQAAALFASHGEPFNKDGWMKVVEKHKGFLPIKIKAVPEGTIVPTGNILMSVESTDPELAWVSSYIETLLSRVWYPSTVATRSWACKQIIKRYLDKNSDDPEGQIKFKLHDFGSRGSTSAESAAIGGAAHLVNFLGTDTVVALSFLQKYYGAKMAGFSIPAAEHSTITAWGKEGEVKAYENMIKQYGDGGMFACVSDSYNIYNACRDIWGEKLRRQVQEMNATLVVRPDSGDPVSVVCSVIDILAEKFGTSLNYKGYKVLKNVRIIQGDGMNQDQIQQVYHAIDQKGYSADNLAVGMGGGLLQSLNRDTCKFAYKTSYMEIDGRGVDIYKDPITDKGKQSKRGRLSLIDNLGKLQTVPQTAYGDLLETVWENGKLVRDENLEDIRARANRSLIRI